MTINRFLVSFFVVVVLLGPSWAVAGDVDPSGTYDFILSDTAVKGPCPMGKDGTGQITIEKSGGGYVIKYLKGMVCNPPNVCVLAGSCNGDECKFVTTVPVDNEGGKVTNTANLKFVKNHALGSGSCVYQHPKMTCSWTYLLTLTKAE